ncbi:hypothetical protein ACWEOH_02440 [Agromyces sp. NPDC004153]
MSKKKRGTSEATELIAVKVMTEQRWAYERRLEHRSYAQMRELVARPEADGGLGYDVSEHRLKSLVGGYRDRMAEVEVMHVEEHRERELTDLDMVQRYARAAMEKAAAAGSFDDKAVDRFLKAGESRRKLLGLDSPAEAKVDVSNDEAVTEELNAMLARAGRGPLAKVHHDAVTEELNAMLISLGEEPIEPH